MLACLLCHGEEFGSILSKLYDVLASFMFAKFVAAKCRGVFAKFFTRQVLIETTEVECHFICVHRDVINQRLCGEFKARSSEVYDFAATGAHLL